MASPKIPLDGPTTPRLRQNSLKPSSSLSGGGYEEDIDFSITTGKRLSTQGYIPPSSPLLGGIPYRSTTTKWPRTRRLLTALLRSRKVTFLLVSIMAIVVLILANSQRRRTFRPSVFEEDCPYLPSGSDCSLDPFQSLSYNATSGHLIFPATSPKRKFPWDPAVPPQPHPIHLLIKKAEKEWTEKLRRQSGSLKEAAAEYRRRYGRAPPRGFGDWYRFARTNNVQMVDEYDSINERILPFMSLPPHVLKARSDMLQHDEGFWLRDHTFTIQVREHGRSVNVTGPWGDRGPRATQMVDLLKGFVRNLPTDLDLVMTGHDVPWVVIAGEARQRHVAAALKGEFVAESDYENFSEDPGLNGWTLICPPNSTIRTAGYFEERVEAVPPPQMSFIEDHVAAMDVCNHPERQGIHGFTAWPGPRPGLLFPLFAFTSSSLHNDLLVPPLEQYERAVGPDPAWSDKKHNKVLWRGSTTGSDLTLQNMRKLSQRPRLCRLPKQTGQLLLPFALSDSPGLPGPVTMANLSSFALAEEYFDFKFTGRAQQCGDEAMCKKFEADFEWEGYMSEADQNEYKYVLDVDGNGWSGRFHRLMSSNTLVLKSTIFPEWYADRIQPWYHYVPISIDYQDLWSVMAFFKGDLDGRGSHDAIAHKLASQGKRWAEEYWRWEDMQAYFFRLILEYSRVLNKDINNPKNMDFDDSRL